MTSGLRWKDLTNAEKDRIASLYKQGDLRKAFTDEADRLGVTVESLGRYVRLHVSGDEPPYKRYARAKQALATSTPTTPQQKSDDQRWHEFLNDRARDVLRVMHLCDIHAPFQDAEAYALAIEMVKRFQPDVVVVGSDFADFYGLSRFDTNPDVDSAVDELDVFEQHWNPHIHDIRSSAGQAKIVHISGNHDRRLLTFLQNKAPKMRKRVKRDFESIIQCGGAVTWLGWRDDVWIAHDRTVTPLAIQHGTRCNEHVA
jgi:hypothetical protein